MQVFGEILVEFLGQVLFHFVHVFFGNTALKTHIIVVLVALSILAKCYGALKDGNPVVLTFCEMDGIKRREARLQGDTSMINVGSTCDFN